MVKCTEFYCCGKLCGSSSFVPSEELILEQSISNIKLTRTAVASSSALVAHQIPVPNQHKTILWQHLRVMPMNLVNKNKHNKTNES